MYIYIYIIIRSHAFWLKTDLIIRSNLFGLKTDSISCRDKERIVQGQLAQLRLTLVV
jgi:hypothetical protein